ncbi:MAG TPA: helix-turn-helix domain-containing protein [Pseudonocardiaceae bacterium]
MGMPQLVVTAVLVERRTKSEVARQYGVSRRWVITLVQRYLAEGDAGLAPRSRRPRTSPQRTTQELEDEIVAIRKDLDKSGYEAGAATIAFHLQQRRGASPAVCTIWRILSQRGFVTPQPHKRPKSSYLRFAAEQPNERWQLDITHWQLAAGTDVEILNLLDDHFRLGVGSDTLRVFKAYDVDDRFGKAAASYGDPPQHAVGQRGRVHRPLPWRRTRRPGGHPQPPRRQLSALPPLSPTNLRQGRTVPSDP